MNLDELNKRLDTAAEGADAWKPTKAGDQIAGRITSVGEITTDYGTSVRVTLDVQEGSAVVDGKKSKLDVASVAMFGSVLDRWSREAGLRVGDEIAVRYLGLEKAQTGDRSYKNFALVHERPTMADKLDAAATEAAGDFT